MKLTNEVLHIMLLNLKLVLIMHLLLTARAAESRMGSGKGAVDYWVAVVRPGTIIFGT